MICREKLLARSTLLAFIALSTGLCALSRAGESLTANAMNVALSGSTTTEMTVKVGEQDANSAVEMQMGNTLEVRLSGNPTTGYTWEVASVDNAILRQIGETEFSAEKQRRGAGGTLTMRFKAVEKGQTLLKLIYHRPFEKNVPPVATFQIAVTVK